MKYILTNILNILTLPHQPRPTRVATLFMLALLTCAPCWSASYDQLIAEAITQATQQELNNW